MNKLQHLALMLGAVTSLTVAAPLAIAAPITALPKPDVGSNVLTVQAYHRSCGWVDNGWRYRSGGRYIDCRPRRPFGRDWIWRTEGPRFGWYNSRRNNWHYNRW
jgi:hypothetical protein